MTVPVILFNEQRAKDAFAAYRALRLHEVEEPKLRDNPAWNALARDAYENFELAFEALQ